MTKKKRLANMELLRVLAMAMIVTMHFLREKNALPDYGLELTGGRICALLIESFCIVAVNTYVFLSGFMSAYSWQSDSRQNNAVDSGVAGVLEKTGETLQIKKVCAFLCQIWYYLFATLAVLLLLGRGTGLLEFGQNGFLYMLRSYLLPIESDTYFFATAYLLLMLVMPILNTAVKNLERKQLRGCLLALLTAFCFLKSVNPIGVPIDRYGYDMIWFVIVYLLGAYFSYYQIGMQETKHAMEKLLNEKPAVAYIGSVLIIFALSLAASALMDKVEAMKYIASLPFHYNFVFCLTGAIGLFYLFQKVTLLEGKLADLIRKAGKYSFGIYLFHEHPDLRHRWYPFVQGLLHTEGRDGIAVTLLEYIVSLLLLFAAGYAMEAVRVFLINLWKGVRPVHERK